MCNAVEESSTHLFLLCPFARAIWHGSTLSIHTSEFSNLSIHQWLKSILFNHKGKDDISMAYLQAVFTTLWSIWTYRNRVIHQGICPNPLEVILMAQSLSCRYRSTFSNFAQDLSAAATTPSLSRIAADHQQCLAGPWDLIIKIAGAKGQRNQRRAIAYNANNIEGLSFLVQLVRWQNHPRGPCLKLWLLLVSQLEIMDFIIFCF